MGRKRFAERERKTVIDFGYSYQARMEMKMYNMLQAFSMFLAAYAARIESHRMPDAKTH